jgi:diadenosine tetraphosphatase ApaH/serine/threonine PP2A family protein phosphatase
VRRKAREPLTLVGHTHCQRAWRVWRGDVSYVEGATVALEPGRQYVVNPGSVGQPRDRDPRAAYAIWDGEAEALELRRVEYDIAAAAERIRAAGLPEFLAERLEAGR